MSKKPGKTPLLSLTIVIFSSMFFALFMIDQFLHRGTKTESCYGMNYKILQLGFPLISTKVIDFDAQPALYDGLIQDCVPSPDIAAGRTTTVITNKNKVVANVSIWLLTALASVGGVIFWRRRHV